MASGDYTYDDPNDPTYKDPNAVADAAQKESGGFKPPTSPTSAWNREEFENNWFTQGAQYGWNPSAYIAATPQWSQGVSALPGSSGDKWVLPGGEAMDLSINYNPATKSGSAAGWTGLGNWNGSALEAYPSAGGGAPAAPGAVAPAASSSPVIDPLRQQLLDTLSKRSQQSLAVDRNDPIIRAQADAFGANEERSKRNYLADLAEKLGPNANLRGETRMANERVGQSTGGYEAELMGRELTARRTEIADALTQMRGMLTTEQEIQLRKELAQMDDAIQRMKLQQDSSQFGATLGYQQASLAQQGRIADNNLGFAYDQFDWDRSSLNPRNILPA